VSLWSPAGKKKKRKENLLPGVLRTQTQDLSPFTSRPVYYGISYLTSCFLLEVLPLYIPFIPKSSQEEETRDEVSWPVQFLIF
jgi:hypothetical protein